MCVYYSFQIINHQNSTIMKRLFAGICLLALCMNINVFAQEEKEA